MSQAIRSNGVQELMEEAGLTKEEATYITSRLVAQHGPEILLHKAFLGAFVVLGMKTKELQQQIDELKKMVREV